MVGVDKWMANSRRIERAEAEYGYTHLIGMIGWSAADGVSPAIYNVAFHVLGLNWRCVPLPVPNGQLRQALLGLGALGFAGAELAEPYQAEALKYLDETGPAARTMGAVKFVRVDPDGRLVGDNLRWLAFLGTLRTLVPSLNGLRPLVIGTGRAAESIVYALTREGLPLTIVDQQMERAIDLVHRLRHAVAEHSFSVYRWPQDLRQVVPSANLIINTTAMETWPDVGHSPWPDGVPFPPDALAFDLVSWPGETRFLQQAQSSGARTVSGLPLLVYETALALEMWTGHPPPVEVIWRTVQDSLMESAQRDISWPENTAKRAQVGPTGCVSLSAG
jgi:shikimate dehydrogenase